MSEHFTTGNCPTRKALERKPGDKGFLTDSIHARHTEKKRLQHIANQNTRAEEHRSGKKRVVKAVKVTR